MSELVVYNSLSFKRSLTSLEKHFIDELHGNKVISLDHATWRQLIAQACVTNGIKDLPSDIEVDLLLKSFESNKFVGITLQAFNLAFYLNAMGTEWERVDSFNCFSVAFMCDVLNNYLELKNKKWIEINKAIKQPDALPKETNTEMDLYEWLQSDIKRYSEGKWQYIEVYAASVAREMFSKKLFTPEDFTAEQWSNWRSSAHFRTQGKWKSEGKRLEFAKEDFNFEVKQEIGRAVYEYILKNKLTPKN